MSSNHALLPAVQPKEIPLRRREFNYSPVLQGARTSLPVYKHFVQSGRSVNSAILRDFDAGRPTGNIKPCFRGIPVPVFQRRKVADQETEPLPRRAAKELLNQAQSQLASASTEVAKAEAQISIEVSEALVKACE